MSEEVKEPKAKEVPKAKPVQEKIPVTVIETRGASSLVEWIDADMIRCRSYIESDLIYDGSVLWGTLANPTPVGPDPRAIDLYKFTERLRKRNVWTKADFLQKRNSVIKSLLEAMEV